MKRSQKGSGMYFLPPHLNRTSTVFQDYPQPTLYRDARRPGAYPAAVLASAHPWYNRWANFPPAQVVNGIIMANGYLPGTLVSGIGTRAPYAALVIIANGKFVFFKEPHESIFKTFMFKSRVPLQTKPTEEVMQTTFNKLMTEKHFIELSRTPSYAFRIPATSADVFFYSTEGEVESDANILLLDPSEIVSSPLIDEQSRTFAYTIWQHTSRLKNLSAAPVISRMPSYMPQPSPYQMAVPFYRPQWW